jgi:hypothetical protein
MSLGFARLQVRDFDGAEASFAKAIALEPRLGAILAPVGRETATARVEWRKFANPEARAADRLGWAEHLARIGRGKDAEQAFVAILADANATPHERWVAVDYLSHDGTLELVEWALATYSPDLNRGVIAYRMAERRARRASLIAVKPRVTALAQ